MMALSKVSLVKQIIFFIFGLGGFITLISLGIWQMNRLEEKQSMIVDINLKQNSAPVDFKLSLPIENPLDKQLKSTLFKNTKLQGAFVAGTSLYYYSQLEGGKGIGYRVLHLFKTNQGIYIPVIIGFIPIDLVDTIPNPIQALKATNEIMGVFLPIFDKKTFTPQNNLSKNEWYWDDLKAIAQHYEISQTDIYPQRLYSKSNLGLKTIQPDLTLPNSHQQYMITWFTLAFFWAIQSIYLFIRSTKKNKPKT